MDEAWRLLRAAHRGEIAADAVRYLRGEPGKGGVRRVTYRLVQVGYGDAPAYQQVLAWVPASVEEGQEMTHILDVAATAPAAEYT